MSRSHNTEVSTIWRCYHSFSETFGDRDHARIRSTQRRVRVDFTQAGNPFQVRFGKHLMVELVCFDGCCGMFCRRCLVAGLNI